MTDAFVSAVREADENAHSPLGSSKAPYAPTPGQKGPPAGRASGAPEAGSF